MAHEPEASPYVLAVAALCSAKMSGPTPAPWVEDCASVRSALGDDGDRYAFLTDEWYAGVASRIHLNSLRADAEGDTVALCVEIKFRASHAIDANLTHWLISTQAWRAPSRSCGRCRTASSMRSSLATRRSRPWA